MNAVRFGIDEILSSPGLLGGRIGLVTNNAAKTAQEPRVLSRVALQKAGVELIRLFSPEHGLSVSAADGAAVSDAQDPIAGLPVVSLYGERLRPTPEQLAELDAVAFDIPDIGSRFYTYIWTLSHVLEACAETGLPLIVLDRPNPIGGNLDDAEGPLLDLRFKSFLGRAAIPVRHSLTIGELARLWNAEWSLNARLTVVPCTGWKRPQHWPALGLPFEPTSPAIRSYESALLYPGLCLFEATNLSVGRGTDLSFQILGAPWVDANRLAAHFNSHQLPGTVAEPHEFVPKQRPFADERCHGIRLRIIAQDEVRPVATGLHLLASVLALHREHFRWANYPTTANPSGEGHFERLIGQSGIRESLEQNPANIAARVKQWTTAPGWTGRVKEVLLYGR